MHRSAYFDVLHHACTLIYTQLVNFQTDEYTSAVAKNVKKARELIEAGFEYVTEMNGVKIFRRMK